MVRAEEGLETDSFGSLDDRELILVLQPLLGFDHQGEPHSVSSLTFAIAQNHCP
jgi:hypothetical protein